MDFAVIYTWLIQEGVHWFLYILAFANAIFLLVTMLSEPFDMYIRDFNYRVKRIREKQNGDLFDESLNEKDTLSDGAMKELAKKLHATRKQDKKTGLLRQPKSIQSFFVESSVWGVVGLLVSLIASHQVVLSLAIGMLFLTVPYMVLVVKVNNIRVKVGNDFLRFVQVFTQKYNANSNDVMSALRDTVPELTSVEMKKLIVRLITELNQEREERGARRAVNEFVYVNGSSWAKRLGAIIVKGYVDQQDVGEQLMFLEKQVIETEEMIEQESSVMKEVTGEAFIMPFIFVGAFALGWYTTKIQGFWDLQFNHTATLLLLIFSAIGVFFSVMIGLLMSNMKNDI